jgi:hypothetical protein
LTADGINQNEGAESSLAWLLSLMTLQKFYADDVLKQSSSPDAEEVKDKLCVSQYSHTLPDEHRYSIGRRQSQSS